MDCGRDPSMLGFEALDLVEKVERRCFEYEGARWGTPCGLVGGEVNSGGSEERVAFGEGDDRGAPAGETFGCNPDS